ncbi:MAG: hypothetical protein ABIO58_01025 [Luteimonas sp.]
MRILYALPAALILVAGCNRYDKPASDDSSKSQATETPAPAMGNEADNGGAGVTMRYRCGDGNTVEILGADGARVTLSDGRTVDLPRIGDSSPPAYAGEALSFAIGSDGGQLSQDEGGQWDCSTE